MRKKTATTETFAISVGETPEGDDVLLDVFSLISSRVLVCCNSGGGKSYLLRKIIELVAQRVPTLIIDPDGEFASLRELIDLVIVGPAGEVPASTATAAKLARRLMELRVNAVIDLSGLGLTDKQTFVKLFLESLLTLPRELWSHTFVVIDEAHKFASTEQAHVASTQAVVALMDQGRKRRLGGILATQRLSKLVASARAEANNVFIGKTAQDLDLRRAVDILGLDKRDWQTIKSFKAGDFFAFGPAFLRQDGVTRFHVARVQTTHEDEATTARGYVPGPSSSILRVVPELSDLQQEVDREKDEVSRLREENAQLRARSSGNARAPSKAELDRARAEGVQQGLDDGARDGFERGWAACREHALEIMSANLDMISRGVESLKSTESKGKPPLKPPPAPKLALPAAPPVERVARKRKNAAPTDLANVDDGGLGRGGAFKLIVVLVGQPGRIPRSRAAFLAGIKPTTTTFRNAMSTLRTDDLMIDHPDGEIEATDTARARFPNVPQAPEGPALVDHWRGKFGEGAVGKLFSVLVDEPGRISRDEAAHRAGINPMTTTFRNAMSTLRRAGVMIDHANGDLELAPQLRVVTSSKRTTRPLRSTRTRPSSTR